MLVGTRRSFSLLCPHEIVVILACFAALVLGQVEVTSPQDTPSNGDNANVAVQCSNYTIHWKGGVAPYTVSIVFINQTAQVIVTSDPVNSFDWIVNQPAGEVLKLQVTDGDSKKGFSGQFTVQPGASNDCLTTSSDTSPAVQQQTTQAVSSTSLSNFDSQTTSTTSLSSFDSQTTSTTTFTTKANNGGDILPTASYLNSIADATAPLLPSSTAVTITPAITPANRSGTKVHKAVIAVVIVVILLLISAAAIFYYLRKRRRNPTGPLPAHRRVTTPQSSEKPIISLPVLEKGKAIPLTFIAAPPGLTSNSSELEAASVDDPFKSPGLSFLDYMPYYIDTKEPDMMSALRSSAATFALSRFYRDSLRIGVDGTAPPAPALRSPSFVEQDSPANRISPV